MKETLNSGTAVLTSLATLKTLLLLQSVKHAAHVQLYSIWPRSERDDTFRTFANISFQNTDKALRSPDLDLDSHRERDE